MPLHITTEEVAAGHGSPEGVVSAKAGTLYRNLDGGAGAALWAKTYGPGTTGWKSMNDPTAPISIPSGAQLPPLAGLITGNPYVISAERRLYLVQGVANATVTDNFSQYPTDTTLVGKALLTGGRVYAGTAHANNNRLVSGVAMVNLTATVPHEVSYVLDTAGTVGADIVTVYVGSDGTAGSAVGYAVAINRSGAYTIKNGATTVDSGNTGQTMIGAGVEIAVLCDATGKVTILRAGQVVASYTPPGAAPTMGNYVGLSPSLVYSSGVISWVAAALGSLNWMRLEAVPPGGTTSQALRKVSGADWDYAWQADPPPAIEGINTVRSGTGAPDNAVGQNGDWYIQTGTPPYVFGPKAGGAWPTPGVSMQGPPGIQGVPGNTGPPGTPVSPGVVGDITTIAFADTAAAGTSGLYADARHRHAAPVNPVFAHVALGDPHTQYALDSDVAATNANLAAVWLVTAELRAQHWLTTGGPYPYLRRTGAVNVTSTSLAAMTAILPAVAAGRKAVVKSIILTNTGTADSWVSLAGDTANAAQFVAAHPVAAKSTVVIDCSLVLDAGKGVFGATAGGGATTVNATIIYADIASTELPALYSWATGLQGGGAVVDLVAPSGPVVLSCLLIGNTSAVDQSMWLGIFGSGHYSELVVPANGLVVFDTPLYFTSGGKLQAQNVTAGGNWLSVTTSGYAAQT